MGPDPRMDAIAGALGGMPEAPPDMGGEGAPPADGGDPIADVMAHIEEVMAMVPPEQQEPLNQALEILRGSTQAGPADDAAAMDAGMMGEAPPM